MITKPDTCSIKFVGDEVNTSGINFVGNGMGELVLTSEHVRAARALLRWEQQTLAERSKVSLPSIKRLEAKPGPLGGYESTVAAIRKALEDAGIEFSNGGSPGVRLMKGRPNNER